MTEDTVNFILYLESGDGGHGVRNKGKGVVQPSSIFDFISVQSGCEQKDFYANFIVQTLHNQFQCWWSFYGKDDRKDDTTSVIFHK